MEHKDPHERHHILCLEKYALVIEEKNSDCNDSSNTQFSTS